MQNKVSIGNAGVFCLQEVTECCWPDFSLLLLICPSWCQPKGKTTRNLLPGPAFGRPLAQFCMRVSKVPVLGAMPSVQAHSLQNLPVSPKTAPADQLPATRLPNFRCFCASAVKSHRLNEHRATEPRLAFVPRLSCPLCWRNRPFSARSQSPIHVPS